MLKHLGNLGYVLLVTMLLAFGLIYQASAQNLYSIDKLDDAKVFLASDHYRTAGEVEDVLFDQNMNIKALVLDLDHLPGMDHDRVVNIKDITIKAINNHDLKMLNYRIIVNLTEQQVAQLPIFDRQWWSQQNR